MGIHDGGVNGVNGDLQHTSESGLSLDVAIAGGGIAGLITATALRRAGHRVTVYERSNFSNEVGAAIHLAPNATRILFDLGFEPERANCVENEISIGFDGKTKAVKSRKPLDHIRATFGFPWYLIHRVDLHNELKRLAFDKDGFGPPAVLKTGHRVVAVDCEVPSLTFSNGDVVQADFVIGADGVHSTVVNEVTGERNVAHPTGFSAYRFLVPAKNLLEDPQTAWLIKDQPVLMASFSVGEKRLAAYPCRNRELMNFVAIHPDKPGENAKEDWNVSAGIEGLLATYSSFHPEVLAFCKHADDLKDLKLWQLLYRSPIAPWTKGKVCVVGDAAHPMLPHQGQGGGMSIEDGGALGVLLSNIASKDDIPARFRTFQDMRFNRTSAVQILSNAAYDEVKKIEEEAGPYVKGQVPRNQTEIHNFFFTYNVMEDSKSRLQQLLRSETNVAT